MMSTIGPAFALVGVIIVTACAPSPPPRPAREPMCVALTRDAYPGIRTVCADEDVIARFLATHGGER